MRILQRDGAFCELVSQKKLRMVSLDQRGVIIEMVLKIKVLRIALILLRKAKGKRVPKLAFGKSAPMTFISSG
jgi:hypothetical protein